MIVASFVFFLILFVGIGLAAVQRATPNRKDYYLASRTVSPLFAGLSAVATNNSGYMFIGVIGFTFSSGLSAIWLMVGWILGDYLASLWIHHRLREATAKTNEASYAAVLAGWQQNPVLQHWRKLAAVIMLVFLGAYAAAQISAGGKALQGVLGWDPTVAAVVVAALILAYSAAGGIRASIWTDVAQSLVMLIAMSALFIVGVQNLGGVNATWQQLSAIPDYLNWFPEDLWLPGAWGMLLFVIGWMFAGLSVIGQPHVMVRFMALEKPQQMQQARAWYYLYFILFYGLATGVGLLSRVYVPELSDLDPELALPTMALELLPAIGVGAVLAGIFAATMSTADSLVLSCSAAVTHDLLPKREEKPWALKLTTAVITVLALVLALSNQESVFNLVILAWSTLASAFAPILILLSARRWMNDPAAIVVLLVGVGIALSWRELGYHVHVYEGLPAILSATLLGWVLSTPRNALRESVPLK
jgi:sodium/proline symporter